MSDFQRFEGHIHDSAELWTPGGDSAGNVVVIAGNNETDTVGIQVQAVAVIVSAHLAPADAIRLGRLLVAAGEDTLSRPRAAKDSGTDESEASS